MSSDGLVENTRLAPLGAEIAFCTAHYVFMAVIVSRLADLEGSVRGMYPSIQGVSLGSKEPRKTRNRFVPQVVLLKRMVAIKRVEHCTFASRGRRTLYFSPKCFFWQYKHADDVRLHPN